MISRKGQRVRNRWTDLVEGREECGAIAWVIDVRRGRKLRARAGHFSTKSAQRCTSAFAPHGMIGTEDVEFFGEPSMIRSE